MKRAFIFIFLLTYSYASVEAKACSTETMFIVTENGTGEKLDEVVSLVKNSYDFDIKEVNPYYYGASPTNDKYCSLGMAISLVINEYGNFIKIKAHQISGGLLVGADDCVPVIKEIITEFQNNNNLPIKTDRVAACQTGKYY